MRRILAYRFSFAVGSAFAGFSLLAAGAIVVLVSWLLDSQRECALLAQQVADARREASRHSNRADDLLRERDIARKQVATLTQERDALLTDVRTATRQRLVADVSQNGRPARSLPAAAQVGLFVALAVFFYLAYQLLRESARNLWRRAAVTT